MQGDGAPHHVHLAQQRGVVDAGAAADPVLGAAAVERMADRRRAGRIGDAHLAQRQHVDVRFDRHHAIGHGTHAVRLVHGGFLGKVPGRLVERHLVNAQVGVGDGAELVHRGAAFDEVSIICWVTAAG